MTNLIAINKSNGVEREVSSEYLGSTEIHTVSENVWKRKIITVHTPTVRDAEKVIVNFSESIHFAAENLAELGRSIRYKGILWNDTTPDECVENLDETLDEFEDNLWRDRPKSKVPFHEKFSTNKNKRRNYK